MGERGQLAGPGRAVGDWSLAQHRRVGRVMAAALGRQEIVVRRLLQEGVTKSVARARAIRHDRHDPRGHRLAHRRLHAFVVHCSDVADEIMLDRSARHSREPEDLLGVVGQCGNPAEEHLAQVRRERVSRKQGIGGEELLRVERVSLRAIGDRSERGLIGWRSLDGLDEPGQLGHSERLDGQACDARSPLHLGQPRADRMASVELVGAIGPDDHEALVPGRSGDECQDFAGRAIRPVEVLDDHKHRSALAESMEDRQHALRHPGLDPIRPGDRVVGVVDGPELGNQTAHGRTRGPDDVRELVRRCDPGQSPERIRNRRERQSFVRSEADRRPLEDHAARRGDVPGQLRHEPALADPRLAADEDRRGPAGAGGVPGGDERGQRPLAPDEVLAGDARRHVADHRQPAIGRHPCRVDRGLAVGVELEDARAGHRPSEPRGSRCGPYASAAISRRIAPIVLPTGSAVADGRAAGRLIRLSRSAAAWSRSCCW